MRTNLFLLLACTLFTPGALIAQSTAFSYQGRLNTGDSPATGFYEMTFTLYGAMANGSVIGTPITVAPLPVTNGLFSATLDFGAAAFTGPNRWLEIAVTVFGSDQPVITLVPRQPILPAPYALFAAQAGGLASPANAPLDLTVNGHRALRLEPAGIGAPNLIGGSEANLVVPGVVGGTIAGGGALNYLGSVSSNHVGADFGTVGGGGQNSSIGLAATVGGGWNNVSTGYYATVSGGKDNLSRGIFTTVGGGFANISGSNFATIGGGRVNASLGDYATVSGGFWNTASNANATVAGGEQNMSSGLGASVGGGVKNSSQGNVATVAGGIFNLSANDYATVGGGGNNWSRGEYATISGGQDNKTSNTWAMVPGGFQNVAAGLLSLAAGRRAQALHDGAFVWADSTPGGTALGDTFASTGNDQFLLRANGGVGINTNNPAGVALNVAGTIRASGFEGAGELLMFNSVGGQPLELKVGGERVLRLEGHPSGAPNVIGGASINEVMSDTLGATIGGGGSSSPGFEAANRIQANYGTISGGAANTIGYGSRNSTISGGWQNTIYSDSGWSTIGGGEVNMIGFNARYSTISGGELNYAGGYASVLAGGSFNVVRTNSEHSSIGGGLRNLIDRDTRFGTIAGGFENSVIASFATVGGGGRNQASGFGSVVAGGGGIQFSDGNEDRGNSATGDWSAVTGGADNVAAGEFSVVGGGEANRAEGLNAVVPGGLANVASGTLSFAAGWEAHAIHNGAFVWADNSPAFGGPAFASTTNNQFSVRAAGGVRFYTDAMASSGVELAPGSGAWSTLSDRQAKENFGAANNREILDKVVALPLTSWNYKAQGEAVRHLGPMAQDFHAAFGLGESDRMITTVDADGVALAAIQGLNAKLEEELKAKDARIAELERRLAGIERRIGAE